MIEGRDLRLAQGKIPALRQWPTPTATGNNNRKGLSKTSGDGLATAVRRRPWPTPIASDHKGSAQKGHRRGSLSDAIEPDVYAQGLRLNPVWVEWLMGWPSGWTGEGGCAPEHEGWALDPGVRVAPRSSEHAHRLRALGNGWVPQQMLAAWDALRAELFSSDT